MNRASKHTGQAAVLALALGTLALGMGTGQGAAAPTVSLSVDDEQVNEGNTITYWVEMNDAPRAPGFIGATVRIGASNPGVNPVQVDTRDLGDHRFWFTEGIERQAVTVRTTRDAATNATNTVTAQVLASSEFSINTDASVSVEVMDHAPPTVSVTATSRTVTMREGEYTQIGIELDDRAQGVIAINVHTELVTGMNNRYPEIQEGHIGLRTVRIYPGSRQGFLPVLSRDNDVVNDDKEVSVTVVAGTGYAVGSENTAEVMIRGDLAGSDGEQLREGADTAVLRWKECGRDALAEESEGGVSLTAVLEGKVEADWSLQLREKNDGERRAEVNKDINRSELDKERRFEPASAEKTFRVELIDDDSVEHTETFGLQLSVSGPGARNVQVERECDTKIVRISDNDTANIAAGHRVRRVVEGDNVVFRLKVDNQLSTNCPIPFDIKVRGQVSGDADGIDTIVSGSRSEQEVEINACTGQATLRFGTSVLAGQQGPRRLSFDLWTTDGDSTTRDQAHGRIRIDDEQSSLARYIVYIDDADTTTRISTPGMNYRLQGGDTYGEGRLEVLQGGVWGTVCGDYWSRRSADVACRSLGFSEGSVDQWRQYTGAYFGAGAPSVPIHFDDVRCRGDEESLFECRRRASGHNCRHAEDVGVSCVRSRLPPGTVTMATVVAEPRPASLDRNEGDTATFWVNRLQEYDTALDVEVLLTMRRERNGFSSNPVFRIDEAELGMRTVTIPAGEARGSISVTMNDDDFYAYELYVDLEIQERMDMGYRIGDRKLASAVFRNGTYKVTSAGQGYFDDQADRAITGWENCDEVEVVSEGAGEVNLAVDMKNKNAVAFDFSMVLVNSEGSAARHNDFNDADATGTLITKGGAYTTPLTVGIVDTKQLEDTEQFAISLFDNGLDPKIRIVCPVKVIEIRDDDTANLTMGPRERTVTEGDDIEFEILVEGEDGDCILPFPISMRVTPVGENLEALRDTATKQARFAPCTSDVVGTFRTRQTAGDQGTRTVQLELGWEGERDYRIRLDGETTAAVRYTVHIVDSEAAQDTVINSNGARSTRPTRANKAGSPPPPPPIRARIEGLPGEHDGANAFRFEVHFSPTPRYVSYRTVQGALFSIGNGRVSKARRLVKKQHQGWEVTVAPDGGRDISIRLNPTPDCEASGAICTPEGGALTTGLTRTVQGPPRISVADASVDEAEGVTLDFEVSLNRAASATTSVDYATSNGTASAGIDYDATSGTLVFATGETRKTIAVTVHDDAHNEGSESMTLTLSNPSGGKLADATATGTINNTDPMPTAWMIRAGRVVGSQVVGGLTERLEGGDDSRMIVGGMGVGTSEGFEDILKPRDPFAITAWDGQEEEDKTRTMSAGEVLRSSAFHVSNASTETGAGPTLSVWGRFAHGGFEAKEDKVTTDGDVTTGIMGLDARWGHALAGLMLTQTKSDGSYQLGADDRGTVESDLTGIYPYASLDLNARVSAWVLAGAGTGELTLRSEQAGAMPTDLSMRLGAIGIKGRMVDGSGPSGIALNVKSDVMWVQMKNADTPEMLGSKADATRVRLVLQGERVFETERGAKFVPNAEIGIRHDSGDAETGTGIELGAGVRYRAGAFSIEGQARGLIVHEAAGYGDWGLSAAMRLNPSASGRGMTLSIAPQWGRTAIGTHQLWSTHNTTELGNHDAFEPDAQIAMDAGYGFGAGPGRGVLTPYIGLTLGREPDYTIRAGTRWQLAPEVAFGVEHTQSRETSEVWARAAVRF